MAKIQDKLYNRIIEGELLELSDEEIQKLGLAKASEVGTKLYRHYITYNQSLSFSIICNKQATFVGKSLSDVLAESDYVSLNKISDFGYEVPILFIDDSDDFMIYFVGNNHTITSLTIYEDMVVDEDDIKEL